MSPRLRRILLWVLPLGLLAAGLIWSALPRPVAVDLVTATTAPLTVRVEGEGQTRVRDVYVVSAPVAGEVQRLAVEVGDPVVGGKTVLATLHPADLAFLDSRARAAAEARVSAADAALTFAQGEMKRAERLSRDGTISRRAFEQATTALQEAEAEATAARAALLEPGADRAGSDCCITVTAPIDGVVLKVIQESRAVVPVGAPLVEVGDPHDLEIIADLLSTDAVQVRDGAAVRLDGWGGAALDGRVRRVEPAGFTKVSALGIDEQRVNVVIDFADPANLPPTLGHGFRVMARITVWQADATLTVPLGAVFRDGDGWAVFRVEDGTARLRPVTLGHTNGRIAEVSDGLSEGDTVILHPGDQVTDGLSVEARPAG